MHYLLVNAFIQVDCGVLVEVRSWQPEAHYVLKVQNARDSSLVVLGFPMILSAVEPVYCMVLKRTHYRQRSPPESQWRLTGNVFLLISH